MKQWGHNAEDDCDDDDDDDDEEEEDDNDIYSRVTAAYQNLNIRVANDSLSFVKMVVFHKIVTLNAFRFLRCT